MRSLSDRVANRALDLAFVPGTERLWRRRLRGRVLCLLYHRVDEPDRHAFLTRGGSPVIRPSELHSDLAFLKSLGAVFLTFRDLREDRFPEAPDFGVVVTFDDGLRDAYEAGLDVLADLDVRGVIFQSSAIVGADSLLWEHALYWLFRDDDAGRDAAALAARTGLIPEALAQEPVLAMRYLRERARARDMLEWVGTATEQLGAAEHCSELARVLYATPGQVRGASEAGFEVASHGHRHLKRVNIDERDFDAELATSRDVLHRLTGVDPRAFSYPFDSRCPGDDSICARHYAQVANVSGGLVDRSTSPLELPRNNWPGPARNTLRHRRWLLTGRI